MKTQYNLTVVAPDDFPPENYEKVWAIKHLRLLCTTQELGLKKAKDIIEFLMNDPHSTIVVMGEPVSGEIYRNSVDQLKAVGLAVEPVIEGPLALIKQAAFEAMELGEHTLARDLLSVLVDHGGE